MKRGAAVKFPDGRIGIFLKTFGFENKQCKVLNELGKIEPSGLSAIIEVEDKDEACSIIATILNIKIKAGARVRRTVAETHQSDLPW